MENMTFTSSNVNIVKCADMTAALSAAAEEAGNTGGFHLPGVLFKQGSRYCVSTALPIRRIRTRLLEINSAKAKGTVADVLAATNRPFMADHASNIAEYLKENVGRRYILPPMTLNVQQPISVYVPQYAVQGHFGAVYVVIPETARLSVTDGGHRTSGVIKASADMSIEEIASFDQDAVAVMITLESDLVQVHQDFADCSKTKPLPKSQLAAYDRRNPANGLVLDLIEKCPLFNDKIDSTSKTLSLTSANLFLTNQVRQLVKELLVGDYAMADDQFEDKAKDLLVSSDSEQYAAELDRFTGYVNRVTEALPVLKEVASLPPGTPRNIIKDRRADGWICLTATGMVIIGRIGHELFRDQVPNWTEFAERLGKLDWSRSGELWQGNIVRAGKLSTQRAPVRVAVEKVRRAIGLAPNHKLDLELEGLISGAVQRPRAEAGISLADI
jgi:DGQHR domain-containing protein